MWELERTFEYGLVWWRTPSQSVLGNPLAVTSVPHCGFCPALFCSQWLSGYPQRSGLKTCPSLVCHHHLLLLGTAHPLLTACPHFFRGCSPVLPYADNLYHRELAYGREKEAANTREWWWGQWLPLLSTISKAKCVVYAPSALCHVPPGRWLLILLPFSG